MSPRALLLVMWCCLASAANAAETARPNLFFFYADDWARVASCYADPARPSLSDVIKTPNIDRLAREGARFNNAFYSCPQCTPSRGAISTGSYFWRVGSTAILSGGEWAGAEDPFKALPKFADLLGAAGYHTDRQHKTLMFTPTTGTGQGASHKVGTFLRYGLYVSQAKTPEERRKRHDEIVEQTRVTLRRVLAEAGAKPFFFVFGPINTHRPFARGSGQALWSIDPETLRGKLPPYLPDVPEIRADFADALGEVLALDLMLGVFLEELEKAGKLDNTLLVAAGDNGLPGVPRGKTQMYDLGSHAPLLMRWPGKIKPGRVVDDFTTLMDLAPTFLEAGGVTPPASMDGRSLMPQMLASGSGTIDPKRDAAIYGRERHYITARPGNLPYPSRALRTKDFLYIRNFKPERWPMGDPLGEVTPPFDALLTNTDVTMRDLDMGLTKAWLFTHRDDPAVRPLFELTLGKRPAEELYDLRSDPHQMKNVAAEPAYAAKAAELRERLLVVLRATRDPRLDDAFDRPPYVEADTSGATARGKKKGKAKTNDHQ